MVKKLISILCVLTIVVGIIPFGMTATAKTTYDFEKKAETLYALGIIDNVNEQNITLKKYLGMMSKIYQSGFSDPIDFGVMMKMIEGNEKKDATVSVADALKYAVITSGYRVLAESNGGDNTAYAKIAADTGISDGILKTSAKTVTFEDAVTILFNMLDTAPMLQRNSYGNQSDYVVANGETMLSYRMNVKKIEGIVSATPLTSIYNAEGCVDGTIELDMNEYAVVDNKDFSSFLGKKVEAYVKYDKFGEETLIHMAVDNSEEKIIEAEDIENVNLKEGYIEYVYNNYSVKRFKLNYPPKVIYNDRFCSDYTENDFMPEIGQVRLVDNNADNRYDVIFIDSYAEMRVNSRATKDMTIVNKNKYEGALVSITLDGETEKKVKILKEGKEIAFGEISIGNTLLVKESKDKIAVTVLVSDEAVEGCLNSYNTNENEITVDGTVYKITNGLIKTQTAKENATAEGAVCFEIGAKYRVFIDAFGNAAYAEKMQEMNYYLYFKSYLDDGTDNVYIVYMNMNNEWNTAPLNNKVMWEGQRVSTQVLLKQLEGEKPQLVKMDFNGKGEVNKIELAHDTDLYEENTFTRTSVVSGYYYSAQRTIDYKLYANSGAVVLKMPIDDKIMDTTLYKFEPVESNFRNDKNVQCRAYDIDEYNFASVFSVELSSSTLGGSLSSDYFLVTKTKDVLYEDEKATEIVGMLGRFSNFSFIVKDEELASKVKKGDLIRYHQNEKGYLDYLTIEFAMGDKFSGRWDLPNGSSRLVAGVIQLIDVEKGIMRLDCGGNSKTHMIVGTNSVIFYDKSSGDVRIGGLSELAAGSSIVINFDFHKMSAIYCVEE